MSGRARYTSSSRATTSRNASAAATTFGANTGLIEERYRLFRENPNAVSAGWREFFADYQPRADLVAPAPAPVAPLAPVAPPTPKETAAPAPAPVTLDGESSQPLRGAAA